MIVRVAHEPGLRRRCASHIGGCNCLEVLWSAGSPACGRVPRPDAVTGRNRPGRSRRSGTPNGVSRPAVLCSRTGSSHPMASC